MILGKRIAEALGILEHEVRLTKPQQTDTGTLAVQHPLDRVIQVSSRCAKAMTSGYESVNRYQPFALAPATSGSGGAKRCAAGFSASTRRT